MGERGIYNEVTDELRSCPCPAGDPIGSLRGQRMPNTPGVLCRVTWGQPLSIDTDSSSLVRFCCNEDGGYRECPVWQFDKDRIARGEHSMGDEDEAHSADEHQRREDLTGSQYGDISDMDAIEDAVQDAVEYSKRWGVVEGRTGTHRGIAT